jgi:hypothetical protein
MSDVIRSGTDCNFLDEFIKDYNTLKINNNISIYPNNEHNCSDDILFDLINKPNEFENLQKANENKKLIHLERKLIQKYNSKLVYFLQKKFPHSSILLSGNFLYPKNGYMGWHTNADTPYLRCYITYSENGDSYFKYYDQLTKKTIVDMDNIGWTLRYFKISNKSDELLWHCVYSNTNRISIGYRIINNLKL